MADGVSFPSPHALLKDSPPPPVPAAQPSKPKHVRRPSNKEAKKASSGRPAAADATAVRPKQSKSRNGCVTCKAKRLKCDEEKPGCQQCAKRKVECGGYKKDFKWRSFEEADANKSYDRQKKATSPKSATDPVRQSLPMHNNRPSTSNVQKRGIGEREHRRSPPRNERPAKAPQTENLRIPSAKALLSSAQTSPQGSPSSPSLKRSDASQISPISAVSLGRVDPQLTSVPLGHSGLPPNVPSPFDFPNDVFDGNRKSHQDFVQFSMPEDIDLPLWMSPGDSILDEDFPLMNNGYTDEDIEELIRSDTNNGLAQMAGTPIEELFQGPPFLFNDSMSPMEMVSPDPLQRLILRPDSDEMIFARFDRTTCGILSVMDGPNENPWRTLIWPLVPQSPALFHAIMAMTSYHHSVDTPGLRLKGHEHKHESLKFIREGISENSIGKQTAIATALALGFAESWDRHIDTGNTHIRGAQALVKSALSDHKRQPLQELDLQRLKFLCNAWVYMDVIARLTAIQSDDSTDFDNTFLFSQDPLRTVMGNVSPEAQGFGIDFGMPIDARLDPLMGCAGTLFPLIGRVANLVRKVCRSQTNSPAIVGTAQRLQEQLEQWTPPLYIIDPEDPTTAPQHAVQTAEAYRLATLLHLHQSVPELPSLPSEEMARKVMNCLATVPVKSRIVIVHIFPLMVAGCVASHAEDRQWVRQRWAGMAQRMRIGVIDRCLQVTEEVWRRRDDYEAVPMGGRRLVATAELQPARRKGEKSVRKPSDSYSAEPGRGGIVYSMLGAEDEGGGPHLGAGPGRPMAGASRPGNHVQERMVGTMDIAYTPRGHAHWVGVMWDWGWEVLLG